MEIHNTVQIRRAKNTTSLQYSEFIKVPALRSGIYQLPKGSDDPQQPHAEDEVYYVIQGAAVFWTEKSSAPVAPGDVIYVPAGEVHRFTQITEDLEVLVVFGAEGT